VVDGEYQETQLDPIKEKVNEQYALFDEYIRTDCIVHKDCEVSAKDIIGQYRIKVKEANRETTKALTDYLDTHFNSSLV